MALGKATEFRRATETLLQKYPDLMMTHYFHAVQLGIDKELERRDSGDRKSGANGDRPAPARKRFLAKVAATETPWRWPAAAAPGAIRNEA